MTRPAAPADKVDSARVPVFDTGPMQSRAEFLKSLGESLARYEAPRVARVGCFTGLAVAALVVASVATLSEIPSIFDGLKYFVWSVLGTILLVFAFFATLEAGAEKKARKKVAGYLGQGGVDMETLLEMARTRKGRFPGSDKVIEVLEQMAGNHAGSG